MRAGRRLFRRNPRAAEPLQGEEVRKMRTEEDGPDPAQRRRIKFLIGLGALVLLVAIAVAFYIGHNKVDEPLPSGIDTVPAMNRAN